MKRGHEFEKEQRKIIRESLKEKKGRSGIIIIPKIKLKISRVHMRIMTSART